jgi:hypothetical protein
VTDRLACSAAVPLEAALLSGFGFCVCNAQRNSALSFPPAEARNRSQRLQCRVHNCRCNASSSAAVSAAESAPEAVEEEADGAEAAANAALSAGSTEAVGLESAL